MVAPIYRNEKQAFASERLHKLFNCLTFCQTRSGGNSIYANAMP